VPLTSFTNPTKFVGPVYEKDAADRLAADKGWVFKQDGAKWRRVVPSPAPRRIFEIRPVRWLLEHGTIVICAGGGGIPTMYEAGANRQLAGVETVIDKDLCSELLALNVRLHRLGRDPECARHSLVRITLADQVEDGAFPGTQSRTFEDRGGGGLRGESVTLV
jgi:hypothetical protein